MDLDFILPVIVVGLIIYGIYKFFTRNKMEEENNDGEEEEKMKCNGCGKGFIDDDLYECEECEEQYCDDCCVKFDNTEDIYCKKCIDKLYPRESKIEYKEKIVEKPVVDYIYQEQEGSESSSTKSKFD